MQLESRPSGLEGPFACLGGLKTNGWHWLNADSELSNLISLVKTNLYMMAVLGVCDRSLLSGMINITVGDEAAADDGETLVVPSAQEEAQASARSAMWGAWASEAALVEDAIGFFPSCGTPQAHEDEFMQAKPTVMNVHLLQFLHRIDVRGLHHWRVFTPITPWESPSDGGIPCEFPGLMELPYVKIIGDSLPGNDGQIYSKAQRIFAAEWQLYEHKKRLTMDADQLRSHPVIYQQYVDQNQDLLNMNGSHEFDQDQSVPESRDQEPAAMRTHAFVRHLNTKGGHCGGTGERVETRTRPANNGLPTVTIEQGKAYVNNHLPEAPAEMPVVRQAVIESICLAYGVPMSMLSAGDATGRAKLNTETAGPETARIFREAQADRKRRLESNIRAMYDHLYATRHVAKFVKETTEKHVKKRYSKKRKADLTVEELEEDDDLNSVLTNNELEKKARVRVSIPTTSGVEVTLMLMEKGVLKYSAAAHGLSRELGLSLQDFRSKRALNDEEKILEGVAPKPEAASKPKKKAKAK